MPELIGYDNEGNPQFSFSDEDKLKGISVRQHNALLDPAPVEPEQAALPVDAIGVGAVPSNTTGFQTADKLFGLNGQERFQTWPERMVRSGVSLGHDVMTGELPVTTLRREDLTDIPAPQGATADSPLIGRLLNLSPVAADPRDPLIERAQDMAGLAGGATLGINPAEMTVASGMTKMAKNGAKLTPVEKNIDLSNLFSDTQKPGMALSALEKPAPVFYSALENAVNNITANKMPADQWLGTLTNAKGVRPEEMEWTGLKNFLAEQKGSVTKDQVQQYLDANKVELKEVNKGIAPDAEAAGKALAESHGNKWNELSQVDRERYIRTADSRRLTDYGSDPKFSKYQLPGGENYRETLLTLPDYKNSLKYKKALELSTKMSNGDFVNLSSIEHSKIENEINNLIQTAKDKFPDFKSSHWDEPNVLAHVRMNDRTMNEPGFSIINSKSGNKSPVFATREEAEAYQSKLPASLKTQIVEDKLPKKSLHLEEIQSDWHQIARDKGYAVSADKIEKLRPQFEKIDNKLLNSNDEQLLGHPEVDGMLKMAVDKKIITPDEAKVYKQVSDTAQTGAVPDAPFKKTWHELVLKRMLREAAEKGYDRLSWTPGEAQAARYDLSKEVKSIHWQPSIADKNSTLIQIHPNSGDKLKLQVDKNGKVEASFPASQGSQFEGKTLAEVIGKEHADKILSKKDGSLEGEGLKIGGEGMKGFYDTIIPKALEKIGKEHGVKVKQGKADGFSRNGNDVHYIDIPQSLKDQALRKGFPLFSSGVMLSPIEQSPFDNQHKLVPVDGNPFE